MTDFMRQIRPANVKNLSFQLDHLFLILLTTGCQKNCFL